MAASEPTSRLFLDGNSFSLTLNQHLGPLAPRTVVPVQAPGLTPENPTASFYEDTAFGV